MGSRKEIKHSIADLKLEIENQPMLFAQLADLHLRIGQTKPAAKLLEEGVQQFPQYETGWVVMGNLHVKQSNPDEALSAFQQALSFNNDNSYVHEKCCELTQNANQADHIYHLRQLKRLDPLDDNILKMLEVALIRQAAIENDLYTESQVNSLMPSLLKKQLIEENLLPDELKEVMYDLSDTSLTELPDESEDVSSQIGTLDDLDLSQADQQAGSIVPVSVMEEQELVEEYEDDEYSDDEYEIVYEDEIEGEEHEEEINEEEWIEVDENGNEFIVKPVTGRNQEPSPTQPLLENVDSEEEFVDEVIEEYEEIEPELALQADPPEPPAIILPNQQDVQSLQSEKPERLTLADFDEIGEQQEQIISEGGELSKPGFNFRTSVDLNNAVNIQQDADTQPDQTSGQDTFFVGQFSEEELLAEDDEPFEAPVVEDETETTEEIDDSFDLNKFRVEQLNLNEQDDGESDTDSLENNFPVLQTPVEEPGQEPELPESGSIGASIHESKTVTTTEELLDSLASLEPKTDNSIEKASSDELKRVDSEEDHDDSADLLSAEIDIDELNRKEDAPKETTLIEEFESLSKKISPDKLNIVDSASDNDGADDLLPVDTDVDEQSEEEEVPKDTIIEEFELLSEKASHKKSEGAHEEDVEVESNSPYQDAESVSFDWENVVLLPSKVNRKDSDKAEPEPERESSSMWDNVATLDDRHDEAEEESEHDPPDTAVDWDNITELNDHERENEIGQFFDDLKQQKNDPQQDQAIWSEYSKLNKPDSNEDAGDASTSDLSIWDDVGILQKEESDEPADLESLQKNELAASEPIPEESIWNDLSNLKEKKEGNKFDLSALSDQTEEIEDESDESVWDDVSILTGKESDKSSKPDDEGDEPSPWDEFDLTIPTVPTETADEAEQNEPSELSPWDSDITSDDDNSEELIVITSVDSSGSLDEIEEPPETDLDSWTASEPAEAASLTDEENIISERAEHESFIDDFRIDNWRDEEQPMESVGVESDETETLDVTESDIDDEDDDEDISSPYFSPGPNDDSEDTLVGKDDSDDDSEMEDSEEEETFIPTSYQPTVSKTMAEMYASQGEWSRAVETYEKLLKQQPENEVYEQRINVLKLKLGRQK